MSRILIVGDGDLSFSASVSSSWIGPIDVTSSCLESKEDLLAKYSRAARHIDNIQERGWRVVFSVDATRLNECFPGELYHRIIFNFPHVGGKSDMKKNRGLLEDFFKSASNVLEDGGEIELSLCRGQGGTPLDPVPRAPENTWIPVELAARAGLILSQVKHFRGEDFPGYTPTGFRSQEKAFNSEGAMTHVFTRGVEIECTSETTDHLEISGSSYQCLRHVADIYRSFERNTRAKEIADTLKEELSTEDDPWMEVPYQAVFSYHDYKDSPMELLRKAYRLVEVVSSEAGGTSDVESLLFDVNLPQHDTTIEFLCVSPYQQLPRVFQEAQKETQDKLFYCQGQSFSRSCLTEGSLIVREWIMLVVRRTSRLILDSALSLSTVFELVVHSEEDFGDDFLRIYSSGFQGVYAKRVVAHRVVQQSGDSSLAITECHCTFNQTDFVVFVFDLNRLAMTMYHIADERILYSKDRRSLCTSDFIDFSLFPATHCQDMSFWLRQQTNDERDSKACVDEIGLKLSDIVRALSDSCGVSLCLREVYVEPVDDGSVRRVSLCFRVTYRCVDRPLSHLLVNRIQSEVRLAAARILGVELR